MSVFSKNSNNSNEEYIEYSLTYSDGSKYTGDVIILNETKIIREGFGEMLYKTGNKYIGFWMNDKPHGKGTYKYSSGAIYKGNFIDGERSGYGIHKFNDGKVYEGEWLRDKVTGYGIMTFPNGRILDGLWINNEFIAEKTSHNTYRPIE